MFNHVEASYPFSFEEIKILHPFQFISVFHQLGLLFLFHRLPRFQSFIVTLRIVFQRLWQTWNNYICQKSPRKINKNGFENYQSVNESTLFLVSLLFYTESFSCLYWMRKKGRQGLRINFRRVKIFVGRKSFLFFLYTLYLLYILHKFTIRGEKQGRLRCMVVLFFSIYSFHFKRLLFFRPFFMLWVMIFSHPLGFRR